MFIDLCKDGQVVRLEKQTGSSLIFIAAQELRTSNMAAREFFPHLKALYYLNDNRSADTAAVMVNLFSHRNKATSRTSVLSH